MWLTPSRDHSRAMTTPAESPTAVQPRLERPAGHSWRGVSRALARATGTDVILWRVLFIVLFFFSGLGLVLYLAGLFAIPQEGQPRSLAERMLHGPDRSLGRLDLVLVVVLVIATLGLFADENMLVAAAVLGAVAFLVLRDPPQAGYVVPPAPVEVTAPAPFATPAPPLEPFVPKPPRPRSVLGRLTVSLALLVVAVEILLAASGNDAINERVVLASALTVVGAGIVVGAWWGRSAGLVVLAVFLSLGLFATTAVNGVFGGGIGEREWRPVATGSYELGIGEATLDLRDSALRTASGTVSARVGIGHLVVLVPSESDRPLPRLLDGLGRTCTFNGDFTGFGGPRDSETGGFDQNLDLKVSSLPDLEIDLEVGIGEIEVCHA
jgi:phage shock protein PspC (stress-responsive transcriptional regulator)